VYANFPWLLDLNWLAYLGGYGPADALGLAAADLFRNLLALLNGDIFALLVGDFDALLLLVDAAHLLGNLLAGLVAALGEGHIHVTALLGQGLANLLLNFVADLLGLIVTDVLPDRGADFALLLVTLRLGLLGLDCGLHSDLCNLLASQLGLQGNQGVSNGLDRTLPLLGSLDLRLGALLLRDELALLLFHFLTDGLRGLVALILSHNLAILGGVAHPLGLVNTICPASLLELDMAVGHGDQDALVYADESALFLSGW